ncbi:hypothetical protein GUITHDRAFT_140056 [Guillardia theta CCMP2712]|uniref:Uncharacterized protein n=1 Tax=Guillardia theta (strain CCMP2712) TaxID=905079 RepID=L1J5Y1_GUITC|nr:hypothetical protein GUITHDRAFT_140056 [Guillardia theta CCMP2712]EKX43911.1 hypothetical protein GUITHDRAFT_140056 [Guillardia theta CCMP2712]|eukprot:XP_005830891.1 hypothetical protein GUITHDRAFT_140056 [Guillardia theta CCMP2712]
MYSIVSIYNVVKNITHNVDITDTAFQYLNDMIYKRFVKRIVKYLNDNKDCSLDALDTYLRSITIDINRYHVVECAWEEMKDGNKTIRLSSKETRNIFRSAGLKHKMSKDMVIYITKVIEKLYVDIMSIATDLIEEKQNTRVTQGYIYEALHNDYYLKFLFQYPRKPSSKK